MPSTINGPADIHGKVIPPGQQKSVSVPPRRPTPKPPVSLVSPRSTEIHPPHVGSSSSLNPASIPPPPPPSGHGPIHSTPVSLSSSLPAPIVSPSPHSSVPAKRDDNKLMMECAEIDTNILEFKEEERMELIRKTVF